MPTKSVTDCRRISIQSYGHEYRDNPGGLPVSARAYHLNALVRSLFRLQSVSFGDLPVQSRHRAEFHIRGGPAGSISTTTRP